MARYDNSRMDTLYYNDDEADLGDLCSVLIDNKRILVEYKVGSHYVQWEGSEEGKGHYKLTCPEVRGRATLHRFHNEDLLEGHWIDDGDEGMWRIHLV